MLIVITYKLKEEKVISKGLRKAGGVRENLKKGYQRKYQS